MKTVKLTKNMLKHHPCDLLVSLGAVDKNNTVTFPSHVYFSKEDYRELRENIRKQAKKEYSNATKTHIDGIVGMELLNYGPNESLAHAIRPGYALVDEEGIEKENS